MRTLSCDHVTSSHRFADVKGWFASCHFIRFNGEVGSPGRSPEAAERVNPLRSEAGRVRQPAVDMWEAIRFIFPLNHSPVPVTDTEGNVHGTRSLTCYVILPALRRFPRLSAPLLPLFTSDTQPRGARALPVCEDPPLAAVSAALTPPFLPAKLKTHRFLHARDHPRRVQPAYLPRALHR